MSDTGRRKLRIGVAGLGRAFSVMLPTFIGDARVALVAAADPRARGARALRRRLCRQHIRNRGGAVRRSGGRSWSMSRRRINITPSTRCLPPAPASTCWSRSRWRLRSTNAAAMIDAARSARVHLVVGHSHSFDAPVRRLRELIASGEFGAVRMINAINYTDYLYRPRRPEELDTAQRRRRGVQSGGAPGRHRAADRRRPGGKRARRDRRLGPCAADRRRLCGAAHVRGRRFRVADL